MITELATVGLSFDSKAIYAAEVSKSFSWPILKRWTSENIAPALDTASREKAFADALSQLVEKAGLRKKQIVFAIPDNESIIRYFEIPAMPRKEWSTAVRFEAQKYLPFEMKDLISDFEIFPSPKKKTLKVVFTAVKKSLAISFAGLFKEAGLETVVMEPDALSLARLRALDLGKKIDEVHALVLAHEDRTLDVILVKGRLILMARTTVVPAEAPELAGRVDPFAKAIALSFSYFSKNFKNEEIRRIVLATDSVYDAREWAKILNARFEIQTENWDLSKIKHAASGPGFAVSCGAALREKHFLPYFGRKIPNLSPKAIENTTVPLPWDEQKKTLLRKALHGAIAGIVCVLAGHIFLMTQIVSVGRNVDALKAGFKQIASEEYVLAKDQLTQVKERWDGKLSFLTALTDKKIYWTEKLSRIAVVVPEEIKLVSMEIMSAEASGTASAVALRLDGLAGPSGDGSSLGGPAKFVNTLLSDTEFMKGFDSVILSRMAKAAGGSESLASSTSFTIDCILKKKG